MTSVAVDIAKFINDRFPGLSAYDPTTLNNRTEGVLVEQDPNTEVDIFLNYEKCNLTISVRETGRGNRGTAKAYDDAVRIFNALKLVQDTIINGTKYDIITAESAPYELYGGSDYSIWKFTISAERATEDLTWQ